MRKEKMRKAEEAAEKPQFQGGSGFTLRVGKAEKQGSLTLPVFFLWELEADFPWELRTSVWAAQWSFML